MLEVKNIHKKFGSNEVLKGVDFKVEKGSVIAVLGNSGSGKTTLLRCISFLEQADKGEITFDDFHKDITAVTRKEIRQLRMKMGFVFQGYNLFRNKTALDNVLEGLTTVSYTHLIAALISVLLPLPDSPTSPRISPGVSEKLTSWTTASPSKDISTES